jgi:hypothetical protein
MGKCKSPLQCTVFCGHLGVVRLLFETSVDINDLGDLFGTPLQAAANTGDLDIVQFLIHAGAHVNSPGLGFGDALRAASLYGYDDIVCLLLENGANVRGNGDGLIYTSTLQAAMLRKHCTTAHLLLQQYGFIERPILCSITRLWTLLCSPKSRRRTNTWRNVFMGENISCFSVFVILNMTPLEVY